MVKKTQSLNEMYNYHHEYLVQLKLNQFFLQILQTNPSFINIMIRFVFSIKVPDRN